MIYLLDTQLLIWVIIGSPRLSPAARKIISDPTVKTVFSVVSIWEVAIKHSLRPTDIPIPSEPLRDALLAIDFEELTMLAPHAIAVGSLPLIHGDPFDRLLIAQAKVEGFTFLTSDKILGDYGAPVQVV